jgi:hypothetical protein
MTRDVQPIDLVLDSRLFQPAYCLYAYALHDAERLYGYIGITGDRQRHSARSPIRRFAAHLDMSVGSTQNQLTQGVYNYIIQKGSLAWALIKEDVTADRANVRERIMQKMAGMHIRYRVYPLIQFSQNLTEEAHLENRKDVEALESVAVHLLSGQVTLFNNLDQKRNYTTQALPEHLIGRWKGVLDDLVGWFDARKEGVK